MKTLQSKIEIIRKILAKIEGENNLTELFCCIDPNSKKFRSFLQNEFVML